MTYKVAYYHGANGYDVPMPVYLTDNYADPLDWDSDEITFTDEAEAIRYAEDAYELIIGYVNDWQSVVVEVVAVAE